MILFCFDRMKCQSFSMLLYSNIQNAHQQFRCPHRLVKSARSSRRTSSTSSSSCSTISLLQSKLPKLSIGQRRIYLIRHGETDWNHQYRIQGGSSCPRYDQPLNPTGIRQAKAARDQLIGLSIQLVISSPLTRAKQTAEIIQQGLVVNNPTDSISKKNTSILAIPSSVPPSSSPAAVPITTTIMSQFGEMKFGDYDGIILRGADAPVDQVNAFHFHQDQMKRNHNLSWPGIHGESIHQVRQRGLLGLQYALQVLYPNHDHICIVAHGRFNRILLSGLLNDPNEDHFIQGNGCINVLDYEGPPMLSSTAGNTSTTIPSTTATSTIDEEGTQMDSVTGQWYARIINFVEHIDTELDIPW